MTLFDQSALTFNEANLSSKSVLDLSSKALDFLSQYWSSTSLNLPGNIIQKFEEILYVSKLHASISTHSISIVFTTHYAEVLKFLCFEIISALQYRYCCNGNNKMPQSSNCNGSDKSIFATIVDTFCYLKFFRSFFLSLG